MAGGTDLNSGQWGGLLMRAGKFTAIVASLLPSLAALLIALVLIVKSDLVFTSLSDSRTLNSLALIALFCLAGLAVGYGIRLLLPSDHSPRPPGQVGTDHHRDRLARYVVIAGTVGIFVTGLSIIIAIAWKDDSDNWKESVLSIFTSVLPVIATWVGTVLAFYFTNETVRRTQQSQAQSAGTGGEPISRPGTMIPYQSIARHELDPAAITAHVTPVAAAEAIPLSEIENLFGPSGPSRVVVFDNNRIPVFVISRSSMPDVVAATDTLKVYLDTGMNREAALKFAPIAAGATIADARNQLATQGVTDLCVTANGRASEPTMGWVPDENLGTP